MCEKRTYLLYFLIKDHPFADGCKRIAASLFIMFLAKNNISYRDNHKTISNSALISLTLMIAESNPIEKKYYGYVNYKFVKYLTLSKLFIFSY